MSTLDWVGALGISLAVVISYDKWHSAFWAAVAGFFSWLYVVYAWLFL